MLCFFIPQILLINQCSVIDTIGSIDSSPGIVVEVIGIAGALMTCGHNAACGTVSVVCFCGRGQDFLDGIRYCTYGKIRKLVVIQT